ncbi:MAG: hypothetical protein AAGI69_12620 [Cyanobacteria bacterium P01_H01_bin.21]
MSATTTPSSSPAFEVQAWEKDGFVGTCETVSQEQLVSVLKQLAPSQSAYFLRWPHRVSGWRSTLPKEVLSPQGQLVTANLELRWQRHGNRYDLLLLSASSLKTEVKELLKFQSLANNQWQTCLRPVLPYRERIPQYPKRFQYKGINPDQLQQRYFRNAQTGLVQFVALALGDVTPVPESSSNNSENNQNG